ncbi:cupin domain-containing protein [Roseibium sp. MMSF_3544]|uniref:cupin domain-containing protein n=1 Tax=unclassified Roseibium TaxID=2629323 RepID=UPI00273EE34F|nr:cupin domain-containing protein [Roseibium sp. MMSF_3544]
MSTVITYKDIKPFQRGDGVETRLLIGKSVSDSAPFTTGTTVFPPGCSAPMHYHNCDEQVTILEGEAEASIGGVIHNLVEGDTAFAEAESPHYFKNTGEGRLVIMWIYGARDVTRTFVETGETVAHLSSGDQV